MIIRNKKSEVFLRDNGFNNIVSDTHSHNKYTTKMTQSTSIVSMPVRKNFNLSINQKNPMQVYVNGAIQSNGLNYVEIIDPLDNTKGIGVDFSPDNLFIDDIVIFEWVIDLNNIMVYRGELDCSLNPDFPLAHINEIFKISVAGKIGGINGIDVGIGDMILCAVNISLAGDFATVGSNWDIFNKV